MPTSLENFRDGKNNKNFFETSTSSVIKLSFIQSSEAFSDDVLLSGNFSVAAGRIQKFRLIRGNLARPNILIIPDKIYETIICEYVKLMPLKIGE